MANIISAVFNDSRDAQHAVDQLREDGVPEPAISVVSRGANDYTASGDLSEDTDGADDSGQGALAAAGVGAGVGAVFGLAAAVPGIGPFISVGFLTHALGALGGSAVTGAVVGGTSGALADVLANTGMDEAQSNYYAGEVERGSTWVGIDLDRTTISGEAVLETLRRNGGRFHS